MGFRHAHFCTNYYPYSYGFSSCTFLYEWLSIFIWAIVMHISVRMTTHLIFESVVVMHSSVRMTIHFYVCGFSSCIFLYEWLSIFMRFSLCTFLYERLSIFFLNRFSSCTFLCEWLSLYQFLSNAFLYNGNSEFLGVFISNVSVSPCAQCSPTHE